MSDALKQDLSQEAEFANMLMIYLLFEQKPELLGAETVKRAAEAKFGEVDAVSEEGELLSYAVKKYTAHFEEGDMPPFVLLGQGLKFDGGEVGALERSQLWDIEDGTEVLDGCKYSVMIADMMGGAAMDRKDRCEMLMDWLEAVLALYPDCKAVWVPAGGKLTSPEVMRGGGLPRDQRFIFTCVNARFFNIEGTDGERVVDTLGMYAVGLPDVQLHFKGLDPNAVTDYAYNICIYNYDENAPIASGETIDGLGGGEISREVQWKCQYEDSLIQPRRTVLDIEAGSFAAGVR